MDVSLDDLQSALQAVQEQKSLVRVSQPCFICNKQLTLKHTLAQRLHANCCTTLQARLSERNVVELINKIQELGLLGSDLLHSISGREYLTKEQLNVEVKDTLKQTGGRVALV